MDAGLTLLLVALRGEAAQGLSDEIEERPPGSVGSHVGHKMPALPFLYREVVLAVGPFQIAVHLLAHHLVGDAELDTPQASFARNG